MADADRATVLAWMRDNNAGPTAAAAQFGLPANRIKQWSHIARNSIPSSRPPTSAPVVEVEQQRLPRTSTATPLLARVGVVRGLLASCRKDAAEARDSGSWQAVNAFARLERQLWIDLDEAIKREAQERADAEQAAQAARPDAELLGSIIGAIRSMPADQREQIMEAIGGPAPLRVVRSAAQ